MEFDIDFNGVVSEEEVKVDISLINYIFKLDYDFIFYIDIFICKYVIYLVLNL